MDDKLRKSRKQEHDVAVRFGGKVNSQSGAGWIRKNDVTSETESIECKYTEKGSFTLKVADLAKAWVHATHAGKRMVFALEFIGSKKRYVVLTEDDYLADQEELVRLRAEIVEMHKSCDNLCARPGGCI